VIKSTFAERLRKQTKVQAREKGKKKEHRIYFKAAATNQSRDGSTMYLKATVVAYDPSFHGTIVAVIICFQHGLLLRLGQTG
jgi:hypothetical protein